jgi:predicted transcriptional regulator
MQIDEVLKRGALSTKELTETLSLSRSAADSALKRLKDKGKIVKVTDKWGLMENEFDE